MNIVQCCNCGWVGTEGGLKPFMDDGMEFDGCPECETDSYLGDVHNIELDECQIATENIGRVADNVNLFFQNGDKEGEVVSVFTITGDKSYSAEITVFGHQEVYVVCSYETDDLVPLESKGFNFNMASEDEYAKRVEDDASVVYKALYLERENNGKKYVHFEEEPWLEIILRDIENDFEVIGSSKDGVGIFSSISSALTALISSKSNPLSLIGKG